MRVIKCHLWALLRNSDLKGAPPLVGHAGCLSSCHFHIAGAGEGGPGARRQQPHPPPFHPWLPRWCGISGDCPGPGAQPDGRLLAHLRGQHEERGQHVLRMEG